MLSRDENRADSCDLVHATRVNQIKAAGRWRHYSSFLNLLKTNLLGWCWRGEKSMLESPSVCLSVCLLDPAHAHKQRSFSFICFSSHFRLFAFRYWVFTKSKQAQFIFIKCCDIYYVAHEVLFCQRTRVTLYRGASHGCGDRSTTHGPTIFGVLFCQQTRVVGAVMTVVTVIWFGAKNQHVTQSCKIKIRLIFLLIHPKLVFNKFPNWVPFLTSVLYMAIYSSVKSGRHKESKQSLALKVFIFKFRMGKFSFALLWSFEFWSGAGAGTRKFRYIYIFLKIFSKYHFFFAFR